MLDVRTAYSSLTNCEKKTKALLESVLTSADNFLDEIECCKCADDIGLEDTVTYLVEFSQSKQELEHLRLDQTIWQRRGDED